MRAAKGAGNAIKGIAKNMVAGDAGKDWQQIKDAAAPLVSPVAKAAGAVKGAVAGAVSNIAPPRDPNAAIQRPSGGSGGRPVSFRPPSNSIGFADEPKPAAPQSRPPSFWMRRNA